MTSSTSPFTSSPISSSLLSSCTSCCLTPSTSLMSWITSPRTSAEELGSCQKTPPHLLVSVCPGPSGGQHCTGRQGVSILALTHGRRLPWQSWRTRVPWCFCFSLRFAQRASWCRLGRTPRVETDWSWRDALKWLQTWTKDIAEFNEVHMSSCEAEGGARALKNERTFLRPLYKFVYLHTRSSVRRVLGHVSFILSGAVARFRHNMSESLLHYETVAPRVDAHSREDRLGISGWFPNEGQGWQDRSVVVAAVLCEINEREWRWVFREVSWTWTVNFDIGGPCHFCLC